MTVPVTARGNSPDVAILACARAAAGPAALSGRMPDPWPNLGPDLACDLVPLLAPESAGRNTAAFSRRRWAIRAAAPALAQRSQHA
jgi:hypothetical protein